MADKIKTLQSEVKKLHYPTKEKVAKSTVLTMVVACLASIIITVDTTAVTKLVELIVSHI